MRILIANRGEIACRIMRACGELGHTSLAVFSEPDRRADFVRLADEATVLADQPPQRAYTSHEAILAAARELQADAIHPGYGFLSENASFAAAVVDAGLVWIGPEPATIELMGRKDRARTVAVEAGIPVVAGGSLGETDEAGVQLVDSDFPVMLKARAGGGGRGMRVVPDRAGLDDAVKAVRREAQALFGDGELLVESYITMARHIEVQVLGDRHGNRIHLFDRDCSLQRNRQKIVEEAPAPTLSDLTRSALCEAALRLCEHVDYTSAGTVEFLVEPDGSFHFLEMNTRLQVEHGVTELVTCVDIVKEQILVATGEPLSVKQGDVVLRGSAIEVRVNAEDPQRGFLGSPGTLSEFRIPLGDGIRVDTGVGPGSTVPPFYDSLIAKVMTVGADRGEAVGRLVDVLAGIEIDGVTTNVPFLRTLIGTDWFAAAEFDTGTLDRRLPELIG